MSRGSSESEQIPLTNITAALIEPKVDRLIAQDNGIEFDADFRLLILKAAVYLHWADRTANDATLKERVPGLTDADLKCFRTEGRWRDQPKGLLVAVALNCVAAIIQGWDQSGTNGANLFWTSDFGISTDGCFNLQDVSSSDCTYQTLILGLVNAAPYITIAFLGCWLSDPLNHWLGRRWTVSIGAFFSTIAPLACAFTNTWPALFGTRILLGIGMGLKEVTVPILTAEISPREVRGALLMSWQVFTAVGIALGSAANLLCLTITSDPSRVWRYQLASAFIPAFILLCLAWTGPESPRWLVRNGHLRRAYHVLRRLRGQGNDLLAARDLYQLHSSISTNDRGPVRFKGVRRLRDLFTEAGNQRALAASSIVMISQQLCGINILSFYSSTIFATIVNGDRDPYREAQDALYFAFGAAMANLIFAAPALIFIDRRGRRALLLYTIPVMFIFLLTAGFCSLIPDHSLKFRVVVALLYLFVIAYSPGMGPVPFTYAAEVFPIEIRELGMGWAVAMNNIFGAALSLAFPSIWERFRPHGTGTFVFFAGLNVVSFILVFLFVRETCGLKLEDIAVEYDTRTRVYIKDKMIRAKPQPRHRKSKSYRTPGDAHPREPVQSSL